MKKKWSKYIESDYERLHTKKLDIDLKKDEIDKIVDVRTGCAYITKTIDSGHIREVETYPIYLKKEMPEEWRIKSTKESMKNLNNKNAKNSLIRKMNTNFKDGDYHLTLEYMDKYLPKNHAQAKKDIQLLIRKLRRLVKKFGTTELKYIYITEHSEGPKGIRCHHHLVMNATLPRDVVEAEWKFGKRTKSSKLFGDECHLTGIATYFSKDPKGKKRWSCSRNLKEPHITTSHSKFSKKKINIMTRYQDLVKEEMEKVNPGYIYIDHRISINTYNGKPYIYARMRKIKW